MQRPRVSFDSAEAVEAGRAAAEAMVAICAASGHGKIVIDVGDYVVVSSETVIRRRYARGSPGRGDPKAREPA